MELDAGQLPPGRYFLEVMGPPGDYDLSFLPPPQPPQPEGRSLFLPMVRR